MKKKNAEDRMVVNDDDEYIVMNIPMMSPGTSWEAGTESCHSPFLSTEATRGTSFLRDARLLSAARDCHAPTMALSKSMTRMTIGSTKCDSRADFVDKVPAFFASDRCSRKPNTPISGPIFQNKHFKLS